MDDTTKYLNVYINAVKSKLDKTIGELCNVETQFFIAKEKLEEALKENETLKKEVEKLKKTSSTSK